MSLATITLVTNRQTYRLSVYGIGKTRGVDWVDVLTMALRNCAGLDWQSLRFGIDGPLETASFGQPYTCDGIEYVRVYNGPPPPSLTKLREAAARAEEAHSVAHKAFEVARAKLELAFRDRDNASHFVNQKYQELGAAQQVLKEAEKSAHTYDASKCRTFIGGQEV